jgi:glycosyltransferase involved in cell wall biosynthesis
MAYTVLHIINKETPPALGAGGANRSACWLADAQARTGYTVYMASPQGTSTETFKHIHVASDIDVHTLRAAIPKGTDILHLHGGFKQIIKHSAELGLPFIQTYRGTFNSSDLNESPIGQNTVFISASQMRAAGGSKFVHHGIPLQDYAYSEHKQDYFLFLAKVKRRVKGVATAIAIARQSRQRLIVAGGWRLASPATWLPLSRYVRSVGKVDAATKRQLLAGARALLIPIQWDEPFGLTTIEAFASGTPVIAMRRGAMPELIREGETGFLCDTPDDMRVALDKVDKLSPATCLLEAQSRFSIETECTAYDELYRQVIAGASW